MGVKGGVIEAEKWFLEISLECRIGLTDFE